MRGCSIYRKILMRGGPVSSRTRSQMGSPRRRTDPVQYPQRWWAKSRDELSVLRRESTRRPNVSRLGRVRSESQLSLNRNSQAGEKDEKEKNSAKNAAIRSSAFTECLAKSKHYRRKKAASARRVKPTRSLIQFVRFKPEKNRDRDKNSRERSKSSKRMRKQRSNRSYSRSGYGRQIPKHRRRRCITTSVAFANRKKRTAKRRNQSRSSRRKNQSRSSRRRNRSRSTKHRRTKRRGRKGQRKRTGSRRTRSRYSRGAARRRQSRKGKRYRKKPSSDERDPPQRKRVLYHGDFLNREQQKVLNETENLTYDNEDKGRDEIKENPLDDVCRTLVDSLDDTPADNRAGVSSKAKDKRKQEWKRRRARNKTNNKRRRNRKRPSRHPRRRKRPAKRLSRPRGGGADRYPGYRYMKDAGKRLDRHFKKSDNAGQDSRSNSKDSSDVLQTRRDLNREQTQAEQDARRKEERASQFLRHRHCNKPGKAAAKTKAQRKSRSCLNKKRKNATRRSCRKHRDRNNNFLGKTTKVEWTRCDGRLLRIREFRELRALKSS